MNTRELLHLIQRDEQLAKECLGVFPSDKLPEPRFLPCCFVANIQDHTQPGSHWVSVHMDEERNASYFDSFAEPPVDNFYKYLMRHSRTLEYNTIRVQGFTSETCGLHAFCFLKLKVMKWSLRDVLTKFYTCDPTMNDCKVVLKYNKMI